MKIYAEQEVREVAEDNPELNQYKKIIAAGGVVLNSKGAVLLIFRKGKWDLPKGKLEGNEPIELCAERETKEETGLTELTLQRPLLITYHTYTEQHEKILKETHWFLYQTPGIPALTPQTDEDIFEALWVSPSQLKKYMENTFELIKEVLGKAGV